MIIFVIVHTITFFKQLLVEECIATMFIMTPIKVNFVESRGMCLSLGGDIVIESMNIKAYFQSLLSQLLRIF